MFDFGDELVIHNQKIPWLIWIQIFVFFLLTLTILLSYFGFFANDDGDQTCSSSFDFLSSSASPNFDPFSTCSRRTQASRNNGTGDGTLTHNTLRAETNAERDDSLVKDLAPNQLSQRFIHPCGYFNLAKQAFLKCLGLGSTSRNSPDREQTHED